MVGVIMVMYVEVGVGRGVACGVEECQWMVVLITNSRS